MPRKLKQEVRRCAASHTKAASNTITLSCVYRGCTLLGSCGFACTKRYPKTHQWTQLSSGGEFRPRDPFPDVSVFLYVQHETPQVYGEQIARANDSQHPLTADAVLHNSAKL